MANCKWFEVIFMAGFHHLGGQISVFWFYSKIESFSSDCIVVQTIYPESMGWVKKMIGHVSFYTENIYTNMN